jgi:hypothetical protein
LEPTIIGGPAKSTVIRAGAGVSVDESDCVAMVEGSVTGGCGKSVGVEETGTLHAVKTNTAKMMSEITFITRFISFSSC